MPPEQLAEITIVVYMNQLAQQLLDIVPAGAGGLLDVVLPGLFESFSEPDGSGRTC